MAPEAGFLPQDIIAMKRDGRPLAPDEIKTFIGGLTSGTVSEVQAAAFAMAVYVRDMDLGETVALTEAMRDSGRVLDWSDLPGPVVDKHSTGGIGDNVSLMLAPIVAAAGGFVPMISGRGLGHSGGTLDKLDAIPGYDTRPGLDRFREVVREAGCAIVGQTADLAPADRTLYAIRDVTGTVESVPLITGSILSKKLAAGLGALVLDVKTGSGAFMSDAGRARMLAETLVGVANGAGLRTAAILTDMNEPLATAAGNALEVRNAVKFLAGEQQDARLHRVTLELAAKALQLAGLPNAQEKAAGCLLIGTALERFARMVAGLGGPTDFVERIDAYLPEAAVVRDVVVDAEGVVAEIDCREIGWAVVVLGGGRRRPEDRIDHAVGFDQLRGIGTRLKGPTVIGRVHAQTEDAADEAARRLRAAYRIAERAPINPLILETIEAP